VALAVALGVQPLLNALALRVVVALTVMAPVYWVDDSVGSLPLVVYLMVAPLVAQLIVTLCVDVYVPPEGLKVGAIHWFCPDGSVGFFLQLKNSVVRRMMTKIIMMVLFMANLLFHLYLIINTINHLVLLSSFIFLTNIYSAF